MFTSAVEWLSSPPRSSVRGTLHRQSEDTMAEMMLETDAVVCECEDAVRADRDAIARFLERHAPQFIGATEKQARAFAALAVGIRAGMHRVQSGGAA